MSLCDVVSSVAYLGPPGTYTQQAAGVFFPRASLCGYPSIADVFKAVQDKSCMYGVVPIENVVQGYVTETLDALYRCASDVHVVDALVMPIHHALGSHVDMSCVSRVLSKDQALHQCDAFLRTHLPQAERVHTDSTAAAVAYVAKHPESTDAAVAGESALRAAGLRVLRTDIGHAQNKTRFVVVALRAQVPVSEVRPARTGVVLYPRYDRIGLLRDILHIVSTVHGLSCSSIQSRPDEHGAFRFYLELEGHAQDPAVQACVHDLHAQLHGHKVEVWVYGVYPKTWFNPPAVRRIAVVGGTGRMGVWFQTFLTQAGYEVVPVGREKYADFLHEVSAYDVVLINVPIHTTCQVVSEVAPKMVPGQLLVDNTSVKIQPVQAMLEHVPEGVEVLGMHTLFGPSIPHLSGENVVFTHTSKTGPKCAEWEAVFQLYGAHVSYCSPQAHDQHMAFHQNLEHFTKLVLASVVQKGSVDTQDIHAYASPNSRATLSTMHRVLGNDALLLAHIQRYNTMGIPLIRSYVEHAKRLLALIEQASEKELVGHIEDVASVREALKL